jgi:putative flippase GtrA
MQAACLGIITVVNIVAHKFPDFPSWMAFAAISILVPVMNFVVMQVWVFANRG